MGQWSFPFFWNSINAMHNNLKDGYQFGDILLGYAGYDRNPNYELEQQASALSSSSRSEYLADRAHTEMREDTAYQRGVADMRKAGLNPYTIGANPAPSSASQVGSNYLSNQLQVLGYILDLKNLDARNRQITNQAIGNVLGLFKKK